MTEGGVIAERVVPALDEAEERDPHRGVRGEGGAADELALEVSEDLPEVVESGLSTAHPPRR